MSDRVRQSSEEAISAGSQSFAAAARLFDRRTRNDAVMLYAWCRRCDDIIDGQVLGHAPGPLAQAGEPLSPSERLQWVERRTEEALCGETEGELDESFEALRRVVRRNDMDHRYPRDLVHGFRMDVEERIYRTKEDLELYCYHVAGVVGIMMAMIMGVRDEDALDRACDLGIAFQLTNIARDIMEDAEADRCYVPEEVLSRAGLTAADLSDRSQGARIHEAALMLLDEADAYYRSAYAGLSHLPARSAWAIAAARRIYRAIGTKIRRAGPEIWNGRPSTTKLTKVLLMVLALTDVAVTRLWHPRRPRVGLFSRHRVQRPRPGTAASRGSDRDPTEGARWGAHR